MNNGEHGKRRSQVGGKRSLWRKLAALAPLLLLVVTLPGQALLKCRIDGSLRTSCCCSDEDQEQSAPGRMPTASAQSCCDQQAATQAARIIELAPSFHDASAVAATLARTPVAFSTPDIRGEIPHHFRQAAPPRGSAPLVLLKQSFLI